MERKGIVNRFYQIAKRYSDRTAVAFGDSKLSYQELDKKSNQIAIFLIKHGEKKNVVVMMEKGIELITVTLGIFKAGYIFIPVNLQDPHNRIKNIISMTEPSLIITEPEMLEDVKQLADDTNKKVEIVTYKDLQGEDGEAFQHNKNCYIYYTSGSTGEPKGVYGRECSLEHFINWEIEEFQINEMSVISQLTSCTFDPFLRDVFTALLSGARLEIPEKKDILWHPKELADWMTKKQITVAHMVPSVLKLITPVVDDKSYFHALCYILLAGEMLHGNDIRQFYKLFGERIQLVNLYGPTETTLAKFYYRIPKQDVQKAIIPVGRPLPQTEALILDEDGKRCVPGQIGEVYIRTPFISSGYYKNPNLTRQVFMRNPFSENPHDIIYKTGDMGRFLDHGIVELVGRKDNQVKLNGIRCELGEIENCMLQDEAIQNVAVVIGSFHHGGMYLCLYFTADRRLEPKEIRKRLAKELQEHMVPQFIIQLDKMPYLHNGKINRSVLEERKIVLDKQEISSEQKSETETKLLNIWERVVGVVNISLDRNFFDAGGTSLLLINMNTQIEQNFPGMVAVTDIFANPSIRKLAEFIDSQKAEKQVLEKECSIFLNEGTHKLIRELGKDGIQEDVFLVSMELFLFHNLSEENEISVSLLSGEQRKRNIIGNFGKLTDFKALFNLVKEQMYTLAVSENGEQGTISFEGKVMHVLTAVNHSVTEEEKDFFELVIILSFGEEETYIKVISRDDSIENLAMKELQKTYIKLMDSFLEQYFERE